MKPSGILETCLYATDLDSAEAFYSDVFSLELYAKVPGRHVFFVCGNGMLLIFNPEKTGSEPKTPHGTTGAGHLCFRVKEEEIAVWLQWLQSKGVQIEDEVTWPGGSHSLYFRDPAGNSLEVASPALWGLPED